MDIIEAKYYSFNYRFWINTGEFWGLLLLLFFELIALLIYTNLLLILNCTLTPIIIIISIRNFNRTKKYLTRIEIDKSLIYLTFFEFDRQVERMEIPLTDFKIEITENLFDRFRRFKLVFSRKSKYEKFIYEVLHKQHEIGDWSMEKQKEVYKIIRDKQGKHSDSASIGRSMFGERRNISTNA